jgi:hypothetical protein
MPKSFPYTALSRARLPRAISLVAGMSWLLRAVRPTTPFGIDEPDGDWHFFQDVPPRQGCARFFGKALADITVLPIETQWDGPWRLRIVVLGRIEWQFDLSSALATRAMNLMGSLMPDTLLEERCCPGRNGACRRCWGQYGELRFVRRCH